MTDDLVKRLLNAPADGMRTENLCIEAADRIEELEKQINFLVQPDMLDPSPSYRGWLIQDESGGYESFWYAYTYEWASGEWDSPHFMMVSGRFDDVLDAVDRRITELKGDTE